MIAGDQNADPKDGDSYTLNGVAAMDQLLNDPLINIGSTPASPGGPEQAALQGGANATHQSNPAFDTADFADTAPGNLRADYVLASKGLVVTTDGVFWPASSDPLSPLVGTFNNPNYFSGFASSDHKLVWIDVSPVPEPSTYVLMGVGLGMVTWLARRRRISISTQSPASSIAHVPGSGIPVTCSIHG